MVLLKIGSANVSTSSLKDSSFSSKLLFFHTAKKFECKTEKKLIGPVVFTIPSGKCTHSEGIKSMRWFDSCSQHKSLF